MTERSKTTQYRKCSLTNVKDTGTAAAGTLQSLLTKASGSVPRPWLRAVGIGDSAHQLLTTLVTRNTCLCGEIVFYEPGRKIPLVDIEKDGSTWQDTIHPKDSSGTKRQFQEQSLFFAVRENHVAIVQSVLLQADELQAFFSWLLQTKAKLIPDTLIDLQNPPAKAALDKLKDHSIRGFKFGERLFTKVKEEAPASPGKTSHSTRKRYVHRLDASPRVVDILLSLGINQPIIDKLSKNPDPGSIHVDVEISYRSRGEKDASKVLHSLAATLGKQEGLDTEIKLSGKSSIKGDELTLRGQIGVKCSDGCVAVEDAISKLSSWLAEQIRSGKVT